MTTLKEKITQLLEQHPEYRDNVTELIKHVWVDEMVDNNMDMFKPIIHFLNAYFAHLTPTDTITRLWRMCQQENERLRGKDWLKRHHKAEIIKHSVVRGDLSTLCPETN